MTARHLRHTDLRRGGDGGYGGEPASAREVWSAVVEAPKHSRRPTLAQWHGGKPEPPMGSKRPGIPNHLKSWHGASANSGGPFNQVRPNIEPRLIPGCSRERLTVTEHALIDNPIVRQQYVSVGNGFIRRDLIEQHFKQTRPPHPTDAFRGARPLGME